MLKRKCLKVKDACILDPMNDIQFESKDIYIVDGIINTAGEIDSSNLIEIDARSRITVAGGIIPSFRPPVFHASMLQESTPLDLSKDFLMAGISTVAAEGLTPFTALNFYDYMNRMIHVHRIPILDVGNYFLILNFLKNGITNYATETLSVLFEKFKGFGISMLFPGATGRWKEDASSTWDLTTNLPFIDINMEKLIVELYKTVLKSKLQAGFIVETGIEGDTDFKENFSRILKEAFKQSGDIEVGMNQGIILKQFSRALKGDGVEDGSIAANVLEGTRMLQENEILSVFIDLPNVGRKDVIYLDLGPSNHQDRGNVLLRGIVEGELSLNCFKTSTIEEVKRFRDLWIAGMKFLLELPANLKKRVALSLMPSIIKNADDLIDMYVNLLSAKSRREFINRLGDATLSASNNDLLGDKELSLVDLVYHTRVVPAKLLGIDGLLGGIGPGQVGNLVIYDAKPEEWDDIISDPKRLNDVLRKPHTMIQSGEIVMKNQELAISNENRLGHTFIKELPKNESIRKSIEQNINKQFLKFYSTHLNSKEVPKDFILNPKIIK
ncbi:MAG: hypothetical protein ACTSWN_17265 [Promethearchaeota archaeon]